jgi:hypothetical protein
MSSKLREHKTIIIIAAVALFLIEIEIFAMAAMKSGRKSRLQVMDANGSVIHETDGQSLSSFDKYYFEKTFGPFDQYEAKLVTQDVPFPFRAWFVAAVGIPMGVILLLAFFVRAYETIFQIDRKRDSQKRPHPTDDPDSRLEKTIARFSRMNIFIIGGLILLVVLAYWILPNAVTYIGKSSLDALIRYKWIFIPVSVVFVGMVVWVIYLRYLLAKKTIETQAEVNKYHLQLEMETKQKAPLELTYDSNESTETNGDKLNPEIVEGEWVSK